MKYTKEHGDRMIKGKLRVEVYKKYNCKCAYCGKKISYDEFHTDHIIPKYKGGRNDIENLNPSCHTCNCVK